MLYYLTIFWNLIFPSALSLGMLLICTCGTSPVGDITEYEGAVYE